MSIYILIRKFTTRYIILTQTWRIQFDNHHLINRTNKIYKTILIYPNPVKASNLYITKSLQTTNSQIDVGDDDEDSIQEEDGLSEAAEEARSEDFAEMLKSRIKPGARSRRTEPRSCSRFGNRGFLTTKLNLREWGNEVDRVAHRLRVEGPSFETQWRMHVDLLRKYFNSLKQTSSKVDHLLFAVSEFW